MWIPAEKDFETIRNWGLDRDPFAAIADYSDRKAELRWLNPEHRELWVKYIHTRFEYIEFTKDFDHYYKTARKPIDRLRWEYLMARKAWFIMPLGWDRIAEHGGRVADLGCGDGDTVQRLINFVEQAWGSRRDLSLRILGTDLNASRIENAKALVQAKHPNITFEFAVMDVVGDGISEADRAFDYCLCTGIFEILDESACEKWMDDMCRVTRKGIYIEDLFERFPGGYPRDNLGEKLARRGFDLKRRHVIFTEPFDIERSRDPMKLFPIQLDQNLWAERCD